MSNWKTAKKEDVFIDEKELCIYIDSDDFGANYICADLEIVNQLLSKNETPQTKEKKPNKIQKTLRGPSEKRSTQKR